MRDHRSRRQIFGIKEIENALVEGQELRLILLSSSATKFETEYLTELAEMASIPVRTTSDASLSRLAKTKLATKVLALTGQDPNLTREQVLNLKGASWLLVNIAYPGNTGFAIRSAEVSGADACFIDNSMLHEGKREALRASMRADRFMPVFWDKADQLIEDATNAGKKIFSIEDVGTTTPWQADLTVPALFVVGGERQGIPRTILDKSHTVLGLPMYGFIPSYNLQAAMAMVMGERLRQMEK